LAVPHLVPLAPESLVGPIEYVDNGLPCLEGSVVVDQGLSLDIVPGGAALGCEVSDPVLDHAWPFRDPAILAKPAHGAWTLCGCFGGLDENVHLILVDEGSREIFLGYNGVVRDA
jgi:hypothetical protein